MSCDLLSDAVPKGLDQAQVSECGTGFFGVAPTNTETGLHFQWAGGQAASDPLLVLSVLHHGMLVPGRHHLRAIDIVTYLTYHSQSTQETLPSMGRGHASD